MFNLKTFRSRKSQNYLLLFFLGLIILNVGYAVWSSGDKYFEYNFRQESSKFRIWYIDSQYVSKKPKYIIPDEIINTYAGWEYVKGINPVLIAADTPPLGRYFIGLSALLFNNQHIVTIIFSVLSLLLMYLVGIQIFKSRLLAILPPLIFSFEPIFKNQTIYSPLLDIMQLAFLLSIFYFFNRGLNTKKVKSSFILVSILLGLFISTKFFITGLTIVAAMLMVLFINKEFNRMKILIFALPISIFVLLLSYVRVFAFNYSIHEFLGIQKYVFLYHKSQLILPLTIWPLMMFNKWYVWYGDKPILSDPQWLLTWPVITISSILTTIFVLLKKIKRDRNIEVLIAWVVFYFLFFSIGQITTRYFVILIPIMYIIFIYLLKESFLWYRKRI